METAVGGTEENHGSAENSWYLGRYSNRMPLNMRLQRYRITILLVIWLIN
jgi:hypothetical protein